MWESHLCDQVNFEVMGQAATFDVVTAYGLVCAAIFLAGFFIATRFERRTQGISWKIDACKGWAACLSGGWRLFHAPHTLHLYGNERVLVDWLASMVLLLQARYAGSVIPIWVVKREWSDLKLCGKCRRKPWPYLMAMFLSSFIAFVTWLTLSAADLPENPRNLMTAGVFLVAVSLLVGYMISCMRRHCDDDEHSAHWVPIQATVIPVFLQVGPFLS